MRVIRARLAGRPVPGLSNLIADVMSELEMDLVLADDPPPDVVFAVVGPSDVTQVILGARARNPTARIMAILPVSDERLARRAIDCGAATHYDMDTPLSRLTFAILALLNESRLRIDNHTRRLP